MSLGNSVFLLSWPKGQLIDNWRCRPSIAISGIVQAIILSFKITLFVCHEAKWLWSGFGWKHSICGHINNYIRLNNYLEPQL